MGGAKHVATGSRQGADILRAEAEERVVELQMAQTSIVEHSDGLQGISEADIPRRGAAGEVVVLDVRPEDE